MKPVDDGSSMVAVYSCKAGQRVRSYDSTANYVNHIRRHLAKSKALALPASLQMFKGFGQMDFACSFKQNYFLRVDSHLLPRQHIEPEEVKVHVPPPPPEEEEEKKEPVIKEYVPKCGDNCHPLKRRKYNDPKLRYRP